MTKNTEKTMGKYFESALTKSGNRKLLASTDIGMDAGFFLEVQDKYEGNFPICFNNETAPALALAILEEAGFTEESPNFGTAVHELGLAIKERATDEAKEQAELEAEALELLNVAQKHNNIALTESWDGFMDGGTKLLYMNMARKARELEAKRVEK